MRSTSSLVRDFLMAQEVGYTFTSKDLWAALKAAAPSSDIARQISEGGVYGVVSKLLRFGYLTASRTDGRREWTYTMVKSPAAYATRLTAGPGSSPGRGDGPHRRHTVAPTRQSLADRLFEIAADIEKLAPALDAVSTEDLLAELMRRQKGEVQK